MKGMSELIAKVLTDDVLTQLRKEASGYILDKDRNDYSRARIVRLLTEGIKSSPDYIPLCSRHAQSWFCERDHLTGGMDAECVVCSFDPDSPPSPLEVKVIIDDPALPLTPPTPPDTEHCYSCGTHVPPGCDGLFAKDGISCLLNRSRPKRT